MAVEIESPKFGLSKRVKIRYRNISNGFKYHWADLWLNLPAFDVEVDGDIGFSDVSTLWKVVESGLSDNDLEKVKVGQGQSPLTVIDAVLTEAAEAGATSWAFVQKNGYLDWKTLKFGGKVELEVGPPDVTDVDGNDIPF